MQKARQPLVLDAFAGAGGFSLGFQLAGCSILGAIERDAWASETFAFNHPEAKVIVTDIERLSDSEILQTFGDPKPSIIVGGPPCQGFFVCRTGQSHFNIAPVSGTGNHRPNLRV